MTPFIDWLRLILRWLPIFFVGMTLAGAWFYLLSFPVRPTVSHPFYEKNRAEVLATASADASVIGTYLNVSDGLLRENNVLNDRQLFLNDQAMKTVLFGAGGAILAVCLASVLRRDSDTKAS